MNQPQPDPQSIAELLPGVVGAPASRRASPRVELIAEVDLSSQTNFFSGFSTDIATGGLFIASFTLVPIGTTVAVRFTLPGGAEISCEGEVQWLRAFNEAVTESLPGMGIRFVDLDPQAKAAIADFIASREPMFFPD